MAILAFALVAAMDSPGNIHEVHAPVPVGPMAFAAFLLATLCPRGKRRLASAAGTVFFCAWFICALAGAERATWHPDPLLYSLLEIFHHPRYAAAFVGVGATICVAAVLRARRHEAWALAAIAFPTMLLGRAEGPILLFLAWLAVEAVSGAPRSNRTVALYGVMAVLLAAPTLGALAASNGGCYLEILSLLGIVWLFPLGITFLVAEGAVVGGLLALRGRFPRVVFLCFSLWLLWLNELAYLPFPSSRSWSLSVVGFITLTATIASGWKVVRRPQFFVGLLAVTLWILRDHLLSFTIELGSLVLAMIVLVALSKRARLSMAGLLALLEAVGDPSEAIAGEDGSRAGGGATSEGVTPDSLTMTPVSAGQ